MQLNQFRAAEYLIEQTSPEHEQTNTRSATKKKQKVVETFTLYAGVYRSVYLCAQGFSSVL